MPYFSRRILVSLCPLFNLDLFKKGYYHISLRLVDLKADQNHGRVACVEVKDMFGPQLTDFSYPGASCIDGERFISQTSLIEYSEQSIVMGECFLFRSECPILRDHTDAYLPSYFKLQLDLMFSGEEDLPKDPSCFSCVSSRTLEFSVDWRKGLHDHFPVLFDYYNMAAIGLTLHASLAELALRDYVPDGKGTSIKRSNSLRSPSSNSSSSGWKWSGFSGQQPTLQLPSLKSILFGISQAAIDVPAHLQRTMSQPSETTRGAESINGDDLNLLGKGKGGGVKLGSDRKASYQITMAQQIERAQDAHHMLCDVLRSARDNLHIGHAIMSQDKSNVQPCPELPPLTEVESVLEAEAMCRKQISQLNASLSASWDWFCSSSIMQPEMMNFLATRTQKVRLEYSSETIVSCGHSLLKSAASVADPSVQCVVASQLRRMLVVPMPLYCKENTETALNSSIIFIEPQLWQPLQESQLAIPAPAASGEATRLMSLPGTAPGLKGFTHHLPPYLMNVLPHADYPRGSGGRIKECVHLVVCVHGLQGNQFDLRLYKIMLTLTLPQCHFEFLMASSNQADTFCDFNLMTDHLLEEVLNHVRTMTSPPDKVSFIGHSLGSIIVRSLVTRPEFASLHPKLHLYLSICGPHLGTKYQNGIVSVGMWAVRKWYSSKSLLQLSLKDAPNPTDSFLYHLSESPSLEGFRHVVLLTSPQDKYVPYHSAKISRLGNADHSMQSDISLQMMQNILEPLRQARVNLVRISVDHCIPTSASSVIGRAAHIAMLDNEIFIEKLVKLHLAQYFVDV